MNTYKNLCAAYYDLDDAHGALQELPFYTTYAQEAQGLILEPMCGTGNFLIPLTQAGFTIEGFDASPFMLERLQQKAKTSGTICTTWQGLIQDLSRPTRYHLIFIPNASFNLLIDPTDIAHCLRTMWNHLAPNGKLVFEVLTTNAIPTPINVWTRKQRMQSDESIIVDHSLTQPIVDNVVTTTHRYELIRDGHSTKIETETYQLRLHDPAVMETLLAKIGFSHIKQIKAFDRRLKPDTHDDLIVFECLK